MLGALGALVPELLQLGGAASFLEPRWWAVGGAKLASGEDLNYLGVAGGCNPGWLQVPPLWGIQRRQSDATCHCRVAACVDGEARGQRGLDWAACCCRHVALASIAPAS